MQPICLKQCVALKQHWQVALKQHVIKPCCSLPIDPEINILIILFAFYPQLTNGSSVIENWHKVFRVARAVDIIEQFCGITV